MEQVLKLENLSCQHCVKRVKDALATLADVENVEVSLEKGSARVTTSQSYSQEDYQAALAKTIYKVVEVKDGR